MSTVCSCGQFKNLSLPHKEPVSVPIVKTLGPPLMTSFIPRHWGRRPSESDARPLQTLTVLWFMDLLIYSTNIYWAPHHARGSSRVPDTVLREHEEQIPGTLKSDLQGSGPGGCIQAVEGPEAGMHRAVSGPEVLSGWLPLWPWQVATPCWAYSYFFSKMEWQTTRGRGWEGVGESRESQCPSAVLRSTVKSCWERTLQSLNKA